MNNPHFDEQILALLRETPMAKRLTPVLQGHLVPDLVIEALLQAPSRVPLYWLSQIADILGIQAEVQAALARTEPPIQTQKSEKLSAR